MPKVMHPTAVKTPAWALFLDQKELPPTRSLLGLFVGWVAAWEDESLGGNKRVLTRAVGSGMELDVEEDVGLDEGLNLLESKWAEFDELDVELALVELSC